MSTYEDLDFYIDNDEPTIDEILDELFAEGIEEEIYKVKVLRNPSTRRATLVFPEHGYLRYIPEQEIQFWAFPDMEDSDAPLKDIVRLRADEYKLKELDEDTVWKMIVWDITGPGDDEDTLVHYHNSGMLISVWHGDDRDHGILMQIMGVG